MILRNDNGGFEKLIHEKISAYLKKDVEEYIGGKSVLIFGGAVRDAIVGAEISDIDIVGDGKSCEVIRHLLEMDGYKKNCEFGRAVEVVKMSESEKNYQNQYELFYLVEMYKDNKQVHVIVPKEQFYKRVGLNFQNDEELCTLLFCKNVDLTMCALAYNVNNGLIKLFPFVIQDCMNMEFSSIKNAVLNHKKNTVDRIKKFTGRGWVYKGEI